jgi:BioD-like phosphotransacetylase family protein
MYLYVTSENNGDGKTTVSAGLGRYLAGKGRRVGYLRLGESAGEADGAFMQRVLGLDEAVADICVVIGDSTGVIAACSRVSAAKDVVIVEGPPDTALIQTIEAGVILVTGYRDKSTVELSPFGRELGSSLLGVVVNKVPVTKLAGIQTDTAATLAEAGASLLGVLPEDRLLLAPSVGELADWLEGEVLNSTDRLPELIENVMVGAMTVDTGPIYYGLKDNKAVVVRAGRPDMQLAALETSIRCLVLCGDGEINHSVQYEAEKKQVPIVRVRQGVAEAVGALENALERNRFRQIGKLSRLAELMGQYVDCERVAG